MAAFHLECSVHRQSASGVSVASEWIEARSGQEAIAEADARFTRLLNGRSGLAMLRDDAGQIIWTARRAAGPKT